MLLVDFMSVVNFMKREQLFDIHIGGQIEASALYDLTPEDVKYIYRQWKSFFDNYESYSTNEYKAIVDLVKNEIIEVCTSKRYKPKKDKSETIV